MKQKTLISGTGLVLSAVLAVALIIVVNANLTNMRLDLTENGLFTLSKGSLNIIHSLKEPITLDFYFSNKALSGFPSVLSYGNRVQDLLKEYEAESNGKIKLNVIEPDPFSVEEDQAVAAGLKGAPVNTAGDLGYFGLVGTNSIDQQKTIPFFRSEREAALEYDITKLIYNLANPEKRVVGVISDLPIFGGMSAMRGMPPQQSRQWTIVDSMKEFFEVRHLSRDLDRIDKDVKVLMVVHPKNLPDKTLYAIDQYVLGGGKAMFFVDPYAENDRSRPNEQGAMAMPNATSELNKLFDPWGIEIPKDKVVGDEKNAMRVQTRGPRGGPQDTLYLPWLGLGTDDFNHDDFSTSQLETINMGSSGYMYLKKGSTLEMTPLIHTSKSTMLLDAMMLMLHQDPNAMLKKFVSENKVRTLAARFSGHVHSAFPNGIEGKDKDQKKDQDENGKKDQKQVQAQQTKPKQLKEGNINIVVVADTDILSDMFWVKSSNFLGMDIKQPFANNGDFIINSLDILSGNDDLISLRSRGEFSRPFTRVEAIRRAAEAEFRDREQQLQDKLKQTEQRISSLQRKSGDTSVILSAAQNKEIDKFRQDMLNTRKELRAVQHELQKNIERLGTELKFINIFLVPLLIMIFAIGFWFYKNRSME